MPTLTSPKLSAKLTPEGVFRQLRAGPAPAEWGAGWQHDEAAIAAHRLLAREAIAGLAPYPENFWGRGIVICAGGAKYFTPAWVCASMLRHIGCELPVQFWHLGERELDDRMRELAADLDVNCIDAEELRHARPARRLGGWELKAYAILHSRFCEVVLLDADNLPLIDPAALFDTPQYREHEAIFWPDYGRFRPGHRIWSICEVEPCDAQQFESGQIVVDKLRCWAALNLAMHYNEHSDFYYAHIHGDKDTFHLAFRRVGKSFAMPVTKVFALSGTMCQHDFQGKRIFQHRNFDKWRLDGENRRIPGFLYDDLCRRFLKELRNRHSGRPGKQPRACESAGGNNPVPFKMFGLQRTCTNLVRRALLDNFHVESLETGTEWKHGPIGEIAGHERAGQLARIVVCVRNPYAWLVSCFAYFRRHFGADSSICPSFSPRGSFADFTQGRHYEWTSPVDRWNDMNREWESFVAAHPFRAVAVRAEDLQDPVEQIRQWTRLETSLGLARKADPAGGERSLTAFSRRVDNHSRPSEKAMNFDYYRRERFLAEYDSELLRAVNARLDWELMGRFGYERRDGRG